MLWIAAEALIALALFVGFVYWVVKPPKNKNTESPEINGTASPEIKGAELPGGKNAELPEGKEQPNPADVAGVENTKDRDC